MRTRILVGCALSLAMGVISWSLPAFGQSNLDGIWQTYNRANSEINADSVIAIGFDGNDGVWSATRYGAQSFIGGIWTDYVDLTKIPSKDIWEIQGVGGTVYFGTRTGLTGYDGSTWTTYTTTNSGLVNAPVLRLADDGRGQLWIGTARGLCRLGTDHLISSFKHDVVPVIPDNGIQDIATGLNGDIWLIFIGPRGFVRLPGGSGALGTFIRQDTISNMPSEAITCIAVDHSGNVWAGMKSTGVVRISASGGTVFNAGNTSAIHSNIINKIEVDQCGNVWVATQHGTAMYDGATWTAIPTEAAHVPNDTMLTISVDGRGHIWFGSYGGLTVFKPLPQACTLITPLMDMTMNADSVLCQWDWNCPGITKYWFEIADNPDFVNSVIDTVSPSLTSSASRWNRGIANNSTHFWRVKAKNDAGWGPFSPTWVFHVSFPDAVPTQPMLSIPSSLGQNYPNPCSERTAIDFYVATHGRVTLTLFDLLGREYSQPFNAVVGPGSFTIPVDLTGISANGPVFYRLEAGGTTFERIMTVVH
ncbi:MAG: hypothetical protein JSS75_03865 [Bacteroidetes bacterium]|nr:hypothetical protein [Bacteroidota bacterium]